MLTHTNVSLMMMMMMMIVAVVVVMIMMMIISMMVMITMMMMMMMLTGFWNVGLEQTRSISRRRLRVADPPSGATLFFVCPTCTALQPVYLSALGFSRSGSAKCLFTVALSAHSV